MVHRFGFFFLRAGRDDLEHEENVGDESDDDDNDVHQVATNGSADGEEREEDRGDGADAVILKRGPIEDPRSSTTSGNPCARSACIAL